MTTKVDELAELRLDWEAFYKKYYGWRYWFVDFSQVYIPRRPTSWHRLIIVAKGLTIQKVYDVLPFSKTKWTERSLDSVVNFNWRTSKNGHYAIWVLDGDRPDESYLGRPAGDYNTREYCKRAQHFITLLERLLLGHKYFDETGKHLDMYYETICRGSGCITSDEAPIVGSYSERGKDEIYVASVTSTSSYRRSGNRGVRAFLD